LYEFIFRPSEFDDGPRAELYEWVGYANQLIINNIGALLIFIFMQPLLLAICFALINHNRSPRLKALFDNFVGKKVVEYA
jgi:hypothetical protein